MALRRFDGRVYLPRPAGQPDYVPRPYVRPFSFRVTTPDLPAQPPQLVVAIAMKMQRHGGGNDGSGGIQR